MKPTTSQTVKSAEGYQMSSESLDFAGHMAVLQQHAEVNGNGEAFAAAAQKLSSHRMVKMASERALNENSNVRSKFLAIAADPTQTEKLVQSLNTPAGQNDLFQTLAHEGNSVEDRAHIEANVGYRGENVEARSRPLHQVRTLGAVVEAAGTPAKGEDTTHLKTLSEEISLEEAAMWVVDNGLYNTQESFWSAENLINSGFLAASAVAAAFTGGTGGAAMVAGRIGLKGGTKLVAKEATETAAEATAKTITREGTKMKGKLLAGLFGKRADDAAVVATRSADEAAGIAAGAAGTAAKSTSSWGSWGLSKLSGVVKWTLLKPKATGAQIKTIGADGVERLSPEVVRKGIGLRTPITLLAADEVVTGGVVRDLAKTALVGPSETSSDEAANPFHGDTNQQSLMGDFGTAVKEGGLVGGLTSIVGSALPSIGGTAGNIFSGTVGAGLSSAFGEASNFIQDVTGMDSKYANIIAGFATFGVLKMALGMAANASGASAIPFSGLAVTVGAGLMAMNLAKGASSSPETKVGVTPALASG